MSSILFLTAAPINVYSKDFWTSYVAAVNEEAAYELGLHNQIDPKAVEQATKKGWKASLFTPNILKHMDIYFDSSTNVDLSSHTTHVHHHHHHAVPPSSKPRTKEEQETKKKKEEEDGLQKYKWLGPVIQTIGVFFTAYTWRGYERCKATYDYTAQVQSELSSKLLHDVTPLKSTLERIVTLKLKVDQLRYKIIYRYFLAFAGIFVGGGLLTLAAYTKQPRLVPWGQIALVASAIWAAISLAFEWHDNRDIRAIYKNIALSPHLGDDALYQLFTYYQDNMTLVQVYFQNPREFEPFPIGQPGGYQPYFGQTFGLASPPTVANGYERNCSQCYAAHPSHYAYFPSAPAEDE
jgi:hypothetical protein